MNEWEKGLKAKDQEEKGRKGKEMYE